MDELTKEKRKLKEVLKKYKEVIASSQEALDSLPKMYKDDPMMMYNLSKNYVTRMDSLEEIDNIFIDIYNHNVKDVLDMFDDDGKCIVEHK